jgi:peptidoglycan/LPS O-acetylase OafA/YrhL
MPALRHEEYLALRRFPALDGLRAIAALMVVAFHYDRTVGWLSGWIGVQVFFVLSGFLITTLMLREESRNGDISIRDFLLRRLFRIVPVYLVVLFIAVSIWTRNTGFTSANISRALPYYLSFLNEFAPGSIYFHTWTIGIEQKFYLVWPLLGFSLLFLRRIRAAVAAVLAFGLLAVEPLLAPDAPDDPVLPYGVLLLGCLLAITLHNPRGFAALAFLTRPPVAVVAAAAMVGAQLAVAPAVGHLGYQPVISGYALAVAVLLPSLFGAGLPGRLLSIRPLRFLGDRSYSIYLVQSLAAHAADGLFTRVGFGHTRFLLVATLAVVFADVLYRAVELPMIKLGHRLTRAGHPPKAVDATTGPPRIPTQRPAPSEPAHSL